MIKLNKINMQQRTFVREVRGQLDNPNEKDINYDFTPQPLKN